MVPRIAMVLVWGLLGSTLAAQGLAWQTLETSRGHLDYVMSLPDGYDADRSWPVLVALPPGPQTKAMVEAGFKRYWGKQARSRGWVVVSPAAPEGETFHSGAERLLPDLLRFIRQKIRVAEGRMHLAGASNGGRSAFRLALRQPFEFSTLTVLPGHPPEDKDVPRLPRLKGTIVRMFVGGDDARWHELTLETGKRLEKLGVDVKAQVLPGEGHVPPSLDGDVIMEHLARLRAGLRAIDTDQARVRAALDDFHDAAAKADADRYFGAFAPEGVFMGTDASERWTLPAFRQWAAPWFRRASAWIFVPQSRQVTFSPNADIAWFDEVLGSAHYGACRGTGVLRLIKGSWKVAQYNLTVPVPNDLLGAVVRRIRAFEDAVPAVTTVYLVRHTEKVATKGSEDPELTERGRARAEALARVLRSLPVDVVYTSEFKRTQATVAPLCKQKSLTPVVVPARDMKGLARTLRAEHPGKSVLVSGHSNTLPRILDLLGVADKVEISDDDYDNLFVVRLTPEGSYLLHLHFDT